MAVLQNIQSTSNNKDEESGVVFNSPLAMGCDLLDQIFKCLPSETVFPMGIKAIEQLMNSNSNSSKQSGYTVIAMMVEGCDTMIAKGNNLKLLLDISMKGSKENDERIHKCASEAIAQLCPHRHDIYSINILCRIISYII